MCIRTQGATYLPWNFPTCESERSKNALLAKCARLAFTHRVLERGGSFRVLHAYRKRSLRYISLCWISSQRVAIASALLCRFPPPHSFHSSIFLPSLLINRAGHDQTGVIRCICAYVYFDGFSVYMGV